MNKKISLILNWPQFNDLKLIVKTSYEWKKKQ